MAHSASLFSQPQVGKIRSLANCLIGVFKQNIVSLVTGNGKLSTVLQFSVNCSSKSNLFELVSKTDGFNLDMVLL